MPAEDKHPGGCCLILVVVAHAFQVCKHYSTELLMGRHEKEKHPEDEAVMNLMFWNRMFAAEAAALAADLAAAHEQASEWGVTGNAGNGHRLHVRWDLFAAISPC